MKPHKRDSGQGGKSGVRLGISSCLLGEKGRYDGGHKLDHYLRDTLGKFVAWVPVCPEVECGLPVPREAMRLVGDPKAPRIVTLSTGIDHTGRMKKWIEKKFDHLETRNLSGFVFKARSPSCGMERVKVWPESGSSFRRGSGMFAQAFRERFPMIPVEDEGRLQDPALRENFVERVFVYRRWQEFLGSGGGISDLAAFHASHKYVIMAHSIRHLRELGRLVSRPKRYSRPELLARYFVLLMQGLKLLATAKKHANVLLHMAGSFKQRLASHEKQELLEVIGRYHRGLIPLVVPVTLIEHYVRICDEPSLRTQVYLHPHPAELMLRNHV